MEGNNNNVKSYKCNTSSLSTLLLLITAISLLSFQLTTKSLYPTHLFSKKPEPSNRLSSHIPTCSGYFRGGGRDGYLPERSVVMSITEFGGVGDGKTSNTAAFQAAVRYLERFSEKGGAQLNVPKGRWLTGSFNLTSNFTLFLDHGAVILGSKDPKEWPIIKPLPSYGRGRERPGGRHVSLIHGNGLTNVVITGRNGTIDGQGRMWWELWWNKTLEHTRGHLVELMNSNHILITNLTFRNSPFWTIHPVYCSNVVVKDMTILAPLNAPNTDGIDPDSSTNVCIEDCYIESGDDLVAIKSGWDQYGMKMSRPSSNITVRRVYGTTPTCSGVGIGSEMSGGIFNVTVSDMHVWDSASGVKIKTDKGRGGFVTNITITNITMERVKIPIKFSRGSNDHPDEGWDRTALPIVKGVSISNVVSFNSTKAAVFLGIENSPISDIYMKDISLFGLLSSKPWHCEYVSGFASNVFPQPCPELQSNVTSYQYSQS